MTFKKLYKIIEERKNTMPKNSHVASLFTDGKDRILQKVGEEAIEVVLAAKGKSKKRTIEEMADLWFHCLVLLKELNIKPSDIFAELGSRHRKQKKI